MSFVRNLCAWPSRLRRRLTDDERGVVSIEFSLMLPLLAVLFLGAVEVSSFIWKRTAISDTAVAAADLTTQFVAVEETSMLTVFQAAERMLAPEGGPVDGLNITVSSVLACECSPGSEDFCFTVLWSHSYENGALKTGYAQDDEITTIPQALGAPSGGTLVLAEVAFNYPPPIGFVIGADSIPLSSNAYFRPRKSREVAHTGEFAVNQANSCS